MTVDGNKLLKLIKAKHRSVRQFAVIAGVHRNSLSEIINGQQPNPKLDTINRIAKALGCDPQDFMMGG